MDRRPLAGTDLLVSPLGFGAAPLGNEYGHLDETEAIELVQAALAQGVNYFDTSPYYGRGISETRLGQALRGSRQQAIISTKAGRYDREYPDGFDFSYASIEASIDRSLTRLQTDYIDIVFLHDIEFADRSQIFEEALPALEKARDSGKVRFIGVSGYPLDVLSDAVSGASQNGTPLNVVLSYCHADFIDQGLVLELMPIARQHDCGVITASPFHMGLLSSQGPPDWHPAGNQRRSAASAIARRCQDLGVSLAAAAVSFSAQLPGPASVLCGMSSLDELTTNLAAFNHLVDSTILAELAAIAPSFDGTRWQSGIR